MHHGLPLLVAVQQTRRPIAGSGVAVYVFGTGLYGRIATIGGKLSSAANTSIFSRLACCVKVFAFIGDLGGH